MLENKSVGQVLRVLELLRQNKRLGFDTSVACSRAIQQVAKESSVRYQTIGDGCRRRLDLADISKFHRLADDWLDGNHAPLVAVLKRNSARSAASQIDAFFADAPKATGRREGVVTPVVADPAKAGNAKPVRITIEDADARMLLVLAQLEGREPNSIALELIRAGVRDRLRATLG